MPERQGLLCAYLVLADGAPQRIGWEEVRRWTPAAGLLWVHLDQSQPDGAAWLQQNANLDRVLVDALVEEETRPRSLRVGDSLLVILRGVNLNPGADPEDMVSVRLWLDAHRIITIRDEKLMAIQDIRDQFDSGHGPRTTGEFLSLLVDRLIDRMAPVLSNLGERLDDLEEGVLESPSSEVRMGLGALRRQTIALRRHIAPQRDVTARLVTETVPWLTDRDKTRLRETADHITRYVEDLDATRERAAVTQEELTVRLSDRMNRTMYVLSLVAAVFLPLGFLTGLLGINVAGIPGSTNRLAFIIVCVVLGLVAVIELILFRRKKWL